MGKELESAWAAVDNSTRPDFQPSIWNQWAAFNDLASEDSAKTFTVINDV